MDDPDVMNGLDLAAKLSGREPITLAHRPEPQYLDERGGDIFRHEKRKEAFGIEVTAPFDARGIQVSMTGSYISTVSRVPSISTPAVMSRPPKT